MTENGKKLWLNFTIFPYFVKMEIIFLLNRQKLPVILIITDNS